MVAGMRQIAEWLDAMGLAKYQTVFADNEIDWSLLPKLTEADLKELGLPLGARKKFLEAVANLGTPTVGASADKPREAERRQVTVMFSDLVGSTALSARMDPEDLREVIAAYQKCVSETVRRFGGFVAKYMGDGVLIYFGYPQAHEDDAERAVRAGLELIAAVAALKSPVSLANPGRHRDGVVVVGDLIGSGEAQERGIVGETPNLAARLQGIAEPNMVVIAEGTRRLLGNLFELEDLGPKDLKGIAGPVRAFAAVRASSVESRFEALHASGLTALVGREEETELAAAALVESKGRRRPSGAALRRGGHWQIAAHGRAARTPRRRATHALALLLLSAAYRQRLLSDHQPVGTCRPLGARRHPAGETRQARCPPGAEFDISQ